MKITLILSFAWLMSCNALADEIATNTCKAPAIPNSMASDMVNKYFNKRSDEYKRCITKYVEEQSALAKTSTDVTKANQAHDAAEAAIKEYNNYLDQLNARNEKAGSGDAEN